MKLVEFQSPGKFFVQLVDNVDLLRLQCTLNQVSVYFSGSESPHIHRPVFKCHRCFIVVAGSILKLSI